MKVMAINSSQRTQGESYSEKMLHLLTEGMQEAGADVEIINLREYEIKFCQGCFTCWTKTPGVCRLKDDMSGSLFSKWMASDIVIYSSPLFYRGVVAQLQAFIERTVPALLPYSVLEEGRSSHPPRVKFPDFVILSVSGFPDTEEFGMLSSWSKYNFDHGPSKLLAEIYRPAAQTLSLNQYQQVAEDVYGAVKNAGYELITQGKVEESTLKRITQPIVKKEIYFKFVNLFWDFCIEQKITPKQIQKRGVAPIPKTTDDMMALLPVGIKQSKIMDLKANIQFNFESGEDTDFFLDIDHGTTKAYQGQHESPDLTIITPFQVWKDIMSGKADGAKQLMTGAYRLEGNGDLMVQVFT